MAEIFNKERTNTPNPSATTGAAAAPPEDEMAIFLHHILSSSSSSSHSSISPIKQMPPSSSSSYIPQSGWEIFRHGKAIQNSALPPPALLLPSDSLYNRRKPLPIDSNRWNGTSADDSSAGLESSALIFSGERSVSSTANFPIDSEKKEGQCVTDSGTICSIGSFLDRQDSLCLPSSGGSLGSPVKDSVSGKRRKPPDSDWDDFDCESEEGQEALEEMSKSVPSRTSLKRSRAAEVHNLSEKRRRSRINEKMKALQNLIPNSNKTDKASMLDEAIEYLKHLQLQVQILSMRNGLNLSTMYMPGGLQSIQMPQMHMGFGIGNSLPPNVNLGTGMGMLPVNQGPSTQPPFSLSSECTPSMVVPNLPTVTGSENPFGMNTSQAHLRPTYQLPNTAEEIYRMGRSILPQQKFDVVQSGRNHLSENKTKPVVLLDGQAVMMEAGDCLEARTILHGENSRQMLAGNVDTRVLIQHLHDLKTVARIPDNCIEEGARDF